MPEIYPVPVFHFSVDWRGSRVGFSEVTGLTQENQVIEYRDGSSPEHSAQKLPGLRKFSNIVLKRGMKKGDNEFFLWFSTVQLTNVERRTIQINLLNDQHEPVMTWTVIGAFPVKVEGPQLKAMGNEVAVESVEIAHEGVVLSSVV